MKLEEISTIYGITLQEVEAIVEKFPAFCNADHNNVIRKATEIYGNENSVKDMILKWPQFCSYDHTRVVREATAVYGDEARVKQIILKWPQF
jgi:hypothetical protein